MKTRMRFTLPVSTFAAIGKERRTTAAAVASGRRLYAHPAVQKRRISVAPRHANHAASQGRSAHGRKSGSIHGA